VIWSRMGEMPSIQPPMATTSIAATIPSIHTRAWLILWHLQLSRIGPKWPCR
jgi:hypothetical protein